MQVENFLSDGLLPQLFEQGLGGIDLLSVTFGLDGVAVKGKHERCGHAFGVAVDDGTVVFGQSR